jgi:hypothetical protein
VLSQLEVEEEEDYDEYAYCRLLLYAGSSSVTPSSLSVCLLLTSSTLIIGYILSVVDMGTLSVVYHDSAG